MSTATSLKKLRLTKHFQSRYVERICGGRANKWRERFEADWLGAGEIDVVTGYELARVTSEIATVTPTWDEMQRWRLNRKTGTVFVVGERNALVTCWKWRKP